MSVAIEIPGFSERWLLDRAAGRALLIDTENPERVAPYPYAEAVRMIRLARVVGQTIRRG